LRPEQLALPGHEAHPQVGVAAGAGLGLIALGTVAPIVATAWGLGTAYDFAGDAISRTMGLSPDTPSFTKSFTVGGVTAAMTPLLLPLSTLGSSVAGRVVVGGYNTAVAGTTAFGATAITHSGNADLSAGIGVGSYALGTAMTTMMPGYLGSFLNQISQILSGPAQNAITNAGNKKEGQ
jgi:filamentous hemagglutinin